MVIDSPISSRALNLLKILFGGMSIIMIIMVIQTSLVSDMFVDGGKMWHEQPWFRTTIYDFYFNIVIISSWMFYKEKSWLAALGWLVSFVLLGSIATAGYVWLQLSRVKPGDPVSKLLLRN